LKRRRENEDLQRANRRIEVRDRGRAIQHAALPIEVVAMRKSLPLVGCVCEHEAAPTGGFSVAVTDRMHFAKNWTLMHGEIRAGRVTRVT